MTTIQRGHRGTRVPRDSRGVRGSIRRALALAAAAAVPLTMFGATPAMAEGETLNVAYAVVGDTTAKTGNQLYTSATISCSAVAGSPGCEDIELSIQIDANFPAVDGASKASDWSVIATTGSAGLLDGEQAFTYSEGAWRTTLLRPLAAGESVSIGVGFTAPTFSTPDKTQFQPAVTVSSSNADPVTSTALDLLYTAEPGLDVRAGKTTTVAVGTEVKSGTATVQFPYIAGERTEPGTLGSNGPVTIVATLQAGLEFVGLGRDVPYVYDDATRTLTFTVDMKEGSSGSYDWIVPDILVTSDTAGSFSIKYSASYRPIGQDKDFSAAAIPNKVIFVADTIPWGSVAAKYIRQGNFDGMSAAADWNGSLQPAVNLSQNPTRNIVFSNQVRRQPIDVLPWTLRDALPCWDTPHAGTTGARGSLEALCTNPAFDTKKVGVVMNNRLQPLTEEQFAAFGPMDVVFRYSDGTESTHAVTRPTNMNKFEGIGSESSPYTEIVPEAGKIVSEVLLSAEAYPANSVASTVYLLVAGQLRGEYEIGSRGQNRTEITGANIVPTNGSSTDYVHASYQIVDMSVGAGPLPREYISHDLETSYKTVTASVYANATDAAVMKSSRAVMLFTGESASALAAAARASSFITMDSEINGTEDDWLSFSYGPLTPRMLRDMFQYLPSRLDPGIYTGYTYAGFADADFTDNLCAERGGELVVDTSGIIAPKGVERTLCRSVVTITNYEKGSTFQLTKSVLNEDGITWDADESVTELAKGEIGTFRVDWINATDATITAPAIYDIFPRTGDKGVLLTGQDRGSEFRPVLNTRPVVTGTSWRIAYSTAENPCRPELVAISGCVNDWSTTVPTDLSKVTGIRLTKSTASQTSGVGDRVSVVMSFAVPENTPVDQTAWNSVAATGLLPSGAPMASAEAPRVGIMTSDAAPDLRIDKAQVGDVERDDEAGTARITWSIEAGNLGKRPATDVVVTDVFPEDVDRESIKVVAEPTKGSFDAAEGVWSIGGLAAGEKATITFSAAVQMPEPDEEPKTVVNTASISSPEDPFDPEDPNACQPNDSLDSDTDQCDLVETPVDPQAAPGDLRVNKSVVGEPELSEDGKTATITWSIEVGNLGVRSLTEVIVTDTYPEDIDAESVALVDQPSKGVFDTASGVWNVGALESEETATVSFSAAVVVPIPGEEALTVTNRVTATSPEDPYEPENPEVCQPNDSLETDTDQCDVTETPIDPQTFEAPVLELPILGGVGYRTVMIAGGVLAALTISALVIFSRRKKSESGADTDTE